MYKIKIQGVEKVFEIEANNSKQAIQFFIENNVTVNKPVNTFVPCHIKKRLEYLREQIVNECISYGEIAELQSLKDYIDAGDVQLLQWANEVEA